MPFVNSAQARACAYKAQNDIAHGRPIRWNCREMAKIRYAGRLRKIYIGKRGGHYVLVNRKKVYIHGVFYGVDF